MNMLASKRIRDLNAFTPIVLKNIFIFIFFNFDFKEFTLVVSLFKSEFIVNYLNDYFICQNRTT